MTFNQEAWNSFLRVGFSIPVEKNIDFSPQDVSSLGDIWFVSAQATQQLLLESLERHKIGSTSPGDSASNGVEKKSFSILNVLSESTDFISWLHGQYDHQGTLLFDSTVVVQPSRIDKSEFWPIESGHVNQILNSSEAKTVASQLIGEEWKGSSGINAEYFFFFFFFFFFDIYFNRPLSLPPEKGEIQPTDLYPSRPTFKILQKLYQKGFGTLVLLTHYGSHFFHLSRTWIQIGSGKYCGKIRRGNR
eukprot:TRINITY_DN8674_c0_g1_i17.p1 TRINITY_DN8674_c0_g1~~TRINITY_DN8674_c0_g1_i17.p1  ORF type:complete len:247 (-),score=53.42 TRINITY_DN8674_c0_g1_i17:125-865(-)